MMVGPAPSALAIFAPTQGGGQDLKVNCRNASPTRYALPHTLSSAVREPGGPLEARMEE